MATLDSTTATEYAAELNAVDRAQLIVDNFAAPVSVKVYNGSSVVVGSGVLDAPWATRVGSTVVFGDVTGFAVITSGTPDSNWYLRFESGTRYVQFTFGLSGSGKEAVWSLSDWTAGTQAGIRNSVLTCSGNVAPVFADAPATLNFVQGVGGTYDFSAKASDADGDSLTYSVSPTYTGITIPNGVLTVGSTATAAVRNLTIRATDPAGLYAETTCVVTISATAALDYHPGHYVTTSGANIDTGAIDNVVEYANARSYLKGVVIRPFWRQLETSLGVYDFSLIDHALSTLGTGKYFWLQIQTAIFNNPGAGPADLLPAYLLDAAYDGGAYDDGTAVKTKLWNAAVMGRKIALIEALAAAYNNTANFEGVLTGETAMSIANNEGTSGYTVSGFAAQLQRLFPAARAAFTKKQLMLYCNYLSGSGASAYFQPILDSARAADYVVGGPDSLYLAPTTGRKYINGTLGTTNYRGKIGIQVGDQTLGLNNATYVIADLFDTCFTASPGGWGGNYGFWLCAPSTTNFNAVMSYLASNPTKYVATYPSEYP